MRALVTGGSGFLGSHVIDELRHRGYVVDHPGRTQFDLTRRVSIDEMFARHPLPDVIVHIAARVGGIGANAAEPGRFFYENAIMGIQLMEAARVRDIPKFVTIGTACMYPEFAPVPQTETDLWDGYPVAVTAPYAMAKKALLVQGQAYHEQYGFNAVFLIPTNLYGPRDSFDVRTGHVIPSLIQRIGADAGDVTLWGTGTPTRDFLYVTEAARGIVDAVEAYNSPEPVNLGTGVGVSIRDVADLIAKLMHFRGQILWDPSHPDGQSRRALSVERAKRVLGFEARVPLEEGLRLTVDWWRRQV
jgi:nucleoside-diphosphate-sugar epimerase